MKISADDDRDCSVALWRCSPVIDERSFLHIRNRLALDHGKWDLRFGDSETLARFALLIPSATALQLGELAERLAAESVAAEQELLLTPLAIRQLGLPRPIQALLGKTSRGNRPMTPAAARVIRFDFHPTTDGWRISEANTDVPGGYAESSEFPALMSTHLPGTRPAGHPGDTLARALVDSLGTSPKIALVSSAGHDNDLQVTTYLAGRLRHAGAEAFVVQQPHVRWDHGRVALVSRPCRQPHQRS